MAWPSSGPPLQRIAEQVAVLGDRLIQRATASSEAGDRASTTAGYRVEPLHRVEFGDDLLVLAVPTAA